MGPLVPRVLLFKNPDECCSHIFLLCLNDLKSSLFLFLRHFVNFYNVPGSKEGFGGIVETDKDSIAFFKAFQSNGRVTVMKSFHR